MMILSISIVGVPFAVGTSATSALTNVQLPTGASVPSICTVTFLITEAPSACPTTPPMPDSWPPVLCEMVTSLGMTTCTLSSLPPFSLPTTPPIRPFLLESSPTVISASITTRTFFIVPVSTPTRPPTAYTSVSSPAPESAVSEAAIYMVCPLPSSVPANCLPVKPVMTMSSVR